MRLSYNELITWQQWLLPPPCLVPPPNETMGSFFDPPLLLLLCWVFLDSTTISVPGLQLELSNGWRWRILYASHRSLRKRRLTGEAKNPRRGCHGLWIGAQLPMHGVNPKGWPGLYMDVSNDAAKALWECVPGLVRVFVEEEADRT